MNILFITISRIRDFSARGMYAGLMRKFSAEGHNVFIAKPLERRFNENSGLIKKENITILGIKTLNIQKINFIIKGIAIILLEYQFLRAIKKYLSGISFDLVLYSTPPITFTKVVNYMKQKHGSVTYLLLKDIFPQNAVDLGLIKKGGLLHKYFRHKEMQLYAISDYIGCMSPANVEFIRKHDPEINPGIVEVNPNSIEPAVLALSSEDKLNIKLKYNIPLNKNIFIYGGNLGKPQGINFLLEFLFNQKDKSDRFFIIAGSGTEYTMVERWFNKNHPENALLLSMLPKKDFDLLLQVCDAGMIFLDKRFTIPNFPSRLLSYMESKLPVIAATDKNTDLGKIIVNNNFGFWSEAGDLENIMKNIDKFLLNPGMRTEMGQNGYDYLLKNYTISHSYQTIIKHFKHLNNEDPLRKNPPQDFLDN